MELQKRQQVNLSPLLLVDISKNYFYANTIVCILYAYFSIMQIDDCFDNRVDYPPIRLSCFGIISVSVRQFSPVSFLP